MNFGISIRPMTPGITVEKARRAHINYLLGGPHVLTDKGSIIHSLFIDKSDLDDLARTGTGGLRLYFCREKMDITLPNGSLYLNIIGVPVDTQNENILTKIDATGNEVPAIYNNMEPCPDRCSRNTGYDKSFSEKDLNFKVITDIDDQQVEAWCKPNTQTYVNTDWFDKDGKAVIPQP
jgi:hypothetical protein